MIEIMLDLETMGSQSPNSAIVAIGAVKMDMDVLKMERMPPEAGDHIAPQDLFVVSEFYAVLNLDDCIKRGGAVEGDTVMWWLKQSDEARAALWSPAHHKVEDALNAYDAWVGAPTPHWGNGSDFDNVLLKSMYRRAKRNPPWRYHQSRCFRTLKNLLPKEELNKIEADQPQGKWTAHNALHDAYRQAYTLFSIARQLGLKL
jgi:hypothetical protein